MRVGVLTFHWANNPGAVLQAYALCGVIHGLGHDVEIIDYRPQPLCTGYRLPPLRLWSVRDGQYWAALGRNIHFNRFRKRWLPTNSEVCTGSEQLRSAGRRYDAVIAGSDQIWNLAATENDTTYLLDFLDAGKCRLISYAASIGRDQLSDTEQHLLKTHLCRFHALSVREFEGQRALQAATGRCVQLVLDPTLLLNDYSAVTKRPSRQRPYIAGYILHEEALATARYLRDRLRLPFVHLGSGVARGWSIGGLGRIKHWIGPGEWIGWLQNANVVYTGSFHGTALCILGQTNFCVCPHATLNSRIRTLLQLLGIEDHIVPAASQDRLVAICSQRIDYGAVNERLQCYRQRSMEFLKASLE